MSFYLSRFVWHKPSLKLYVRRKWFEEALTLLYGAAKEMANLEKECLFGNLSLGFGAKLKWPNEKRLFLTRGTWRVLLNWRVP